MATFLNSQPFPHYEPHPDRPGLLIRIDADGTRTVGRFGIATFSRSNAKSVAAMTLPLDQRPVIVALAGPNGAGKTTFYHAHLQPAGLRLRQCGRARPGIAFRPVCRGPRSRDCSGRTGATARELCFRDGVLGSRGREGRLSQASGTSRLQHDSLFHWECRAAVSEQRVAMRVSKGGHDVPTEKLVHRFPRILPTSNWPCRICRGCGCSTTTICERLPTSRGFAKTDIW